MQNRSQAASFGREFSNVAVHTGDLSDEERIKSIKSFRAGETRFIVSTNVLSRGIDGNNVVMAINFELPKPNGALDFKSYFYRVGRAGRFGI